MAGLSPIPLPAGYAECRRAALGIQSLTFGISYMARTSPTFFRIFATLGILYVVMFGIWYFIGRFMAVGEILGGGQIVIYWLLITPAKLILESLPFRPRGELHPAAMWAAVTGINLSLIALVSWFSAVILSRCRGRSRGAE
jgi:hypothetical protein